MISLKKLGLGLSAILFCLSVSAASVYAQPGRARYEGNNGKHKGWNKGNHNGWQKRDARSERRLTRSYQNGRLNSDEYNRLQRRGNRLETVENRYRRDGNLSSSERRRLNEKYTRYNRRITRARNN